jgi:hypothetical protein
VFFVRKFNMLSRASKKQSAAHEKISRAAATLSKLGASKGGKARAASLTPAERKRIAQAAANARWEKRKK